MPSLKSSELIKPIHLYNFLAIDPANSLDRDNPVDITTSKVIDSLELGYCPIEL